MIQKEHQILKSSDQFKILQSISCQDETIYLPDCKDVTRIKNGQPQTVQTDSIVCIFANSSNFQSSQLSPLQIAVLLQQIKSVEYYIQNKKYLNYVEPLIHYTALQLALIVNNEQIVNLLYEAEKDTITFTTNYILCVQYKSQFIDKFQYQHDIINSNGITALMMAAQVNNIDIIQKQLHQVGHFDNQGRTALNYLLQFNQLDDIQQAIQYLAMEKYYSIKEKEVQQINNQQYRQGIQNYTLLCNQYLQKFAVKTEYIDEVKANALKALHQFKTSDNQIVKHIDEVNELELDKMSNNSDYWMQSNIFMYQEDNVTISPLMYAAMTNNIKAVLILKSKFLCSVCPNTKISALMVALRVGCLECADLLLEESACFTAKNVTPFVGAIAGGSFQYAMSKFNDQVNIRDCTGKSALHQAVSSNNYEAVRQLLYQQKITSQKCWTPLQQAAYNGFADIAILLLEQAGLIIEKENTALQYAVASKNINVVKILLPLEAGIVDKKKSKTALVTAVDYLDDGQMEIIELLVPYEKCIQCGSDKQTALKRAAISDKPIFCQYLLKYEKDVYGDFNPLEYAIAGHSESCIKVLKDEFCFKINNNGMNMIQCMVQYNYYSEELLTMKYCKNILLIGYQDAIKKNNGDIANKLLQHILGGQKQIHQAEFYKIEAVVNQQ